MIDVTPLDEGLKHHELARDERVRVDPLSHPTSSRLDTVSLVGRLRHVPTHHMSFQATAQRKQGKGSFPRCREHECDS